MRSPKSVAKLEELGRVQLSPSFFMRDFLYSEISQIEGVPNIPENPDLAIETGKRLCSDVLEPIQAALGRISIRSAYRSPSVNEIGNLKNYSCASNESNYANHIWDHSDKNGYKGAMACIVVNSFLPYYEKTSHWQALAWWVHDNVPGYSSMYFFPKLAAFNIGWHENPEKRIDSWIPPKKGCLTKPGQSNHQGSHESEYSKYIQSIGV